MSTENSTIEQKEQSPTVFNIEKALCLNDLKQKILTKKLAILDKSNANFMGSCEKIAKKLIKCGHLPSE